MQTMTRTFEASTYQEAIFTEVQTGNRDIVVSAVAGSGKSTTLKYLLDFILPTLTVLYCCFNSDAQKSLQAKVVEYVEQKTRRGEDSPVAECSTIHSLGNRTITQAIGKCQIKSNKYSSLIRTYLMNHMEQYDSQLAQQISKLVDMVRLTLSGTDDASLRYLVSRFEIDITPGNGDWHLTLGCVPEVLSQGVEVAKVNHEIDFTDMIWLPNRLNLQPKKYDWVLVDEAQDLSPAQRDLVLKARKAGGRMIFVGDRSQAIYGFAGASLRSIDEIIEATNAVEMPLSICYRCPKSVVDMANSIYPGTEAASDAEDGIVDTIVTDKVADMVQAGDLILCRLTAPLVTMCLDFLRQGKRANVRGKDLGSQFTSLLNNMEKKYHGVFHIDTLAKCAHDFEEWQIRLLSTNLEENEMKIATLQDKIDTLLALYEAYKGKCNGDCSIEDFKNYINAFFAEDKDAQIILSTGHRAKGLEYARVFILQWDCLPHPKARTSDQLTQEHNLMYVMVTRAMKALYLVQASVPMTLVPETEEFDSSWNRLLEEAVAEDAENETVVTVEAPKPEETTNDTTPSKKGRKAKSSEDKRVVYQQMWDPAIKEAFNRYVAEYNERVEDNVSASEMLERLLLITPGFSDYFNDSQYKAEYESRKQAEEQARIDYKNRKKH